MKAFLCFSMLLLFACQPAVDAPRQDFDAVTLDGVGYFLHLEEPETFNEELRKLLTSLTSSS